MHIYLAILRRTDPTLPPVPFTGTEVVQVEGDTFFDAAFNLKQLVQTQYTDASAVTSALLVEVGQQTQAPIAVWYGQEQRILS